MTKEKKIEPKEYFDYLKSKKQNTSDKELKDFFDGCLLLVEKYKTTGQKRIIQKLKFLVDCVEKERQIVSMGINSFVYREDIEEYIDNITDEPVKIIELENYPRDIPDEIVETIAKTKDIFDQMYVVFTDYSGNVEKQITKERREKDPILFGTFQKTINENNQFRNSPTIINDRFYYLGDWEDEYCDLTMDKFLRESGKEKLKEIGTPINKEEISDELNRLNDEFKIIENSYEKKTSIFSKIKKALMKK